MLLPCTADPRTMGTEQVSFSQHSRHPPSSTSSRKVHSVFTSKRSVSAEPSGNTSTDPLRITSVPHVRVMNEKDQRLMLPFSMLNADYYHAKSNSNNSGRRSSTINRPGNPIEPGNTFNVDDMIADLWASRSSFRQVPLKETDVITLCQKVRAIFMEQPILLELEGPLKICGDIHGQFTDLLRLFELCGRPDDTNYLFLGDYVDRGKQSLETICLLFCYKVKYPHTFFLLRGNHECQAITKIYGFFDECKRRYNVKMWKIFLDVFNCLPVASVVENQIFCCHGGLSKAFFDSELRTLAQMKHRVREIMRPTEVPEAGLLCDLLWSDPWYPDVVSEDAMKTISGWGNNERGVSYKFAWDVVDEFLDRFGLDLIIRAHQVVEDGFEFYAGRSLVTLFSAPNYCGEFTNAGGIFCLNRLPKKHPSGIPAKDDDVDLEGSFQILPPADSDRIRRVSSAFRKADTSKRNKKS